MCLDITDDQIAPGGEFTSGGFEHGAGFAYAGRHAEEYFQPTAMLLRFVTVQRGQKRVRIWSVAITHTFILANPRPDTA